MGRGERRGTALALREQWGQNNLMILLGYAVLISLLVYGIFVGVRTGIRHHKKSPLFGERWWISEAWDFGINLLGTFLFDVIVTFAFGGYSFGNALLFTLCVSLVLLLIQPHIWIEKIQKHSAVSDQEKRHFVLSFSALFFLLLELFAFNANAYRDHLTSEEISLDDTSLVFSSTTTKKEDGSVVLPADSYFVWSRGEKTPSRLQFDFTSGQSVETDITVFAQKGSGAFYQVSKISCTPSQLSSCLLDLPDASSYATLKFSFSFDWARQPYGDYSGTGQSVQLSALTFNAPIRFDFSFLRFALCFSLLASIVGFTSLHNRYESQRKEIHRKTELGVLLAGGVTLLAFVIYALISRETFFSAYPLSKPVQDYDIYTQMFDAFKKGQLNIDVPAGTSQLWDHAYYGGKAYSYYGVIPVFLVSFPFFFLTGMVPKVAFLEVFGAILQVTLLLILVIEICRVFFKSMPHGVLLFVLILSVFLSLTFGLVTLKSYYINSNPSNPCVEGIYHIPTIYGLLNLDGFILFALYGYPKTKLRPLYLALSGLFFVFIMASRPNLFLSLIFVGPLFLKITMEKETKWKEKLLAFAPMFAILLVGAIFIAEYNYDRFGSIVEYGQRYQNTISNQSDLSVKPNQIFPALLHFFLNPWTFNSSTVFPFIGTTNPRFTSDSTDYSFYLSWYAGVFSIPLFLSLLSLPFTRIKGGDRWLDAFALLLPVTMIALAIVTYSFAGLCPRYMLEMYHLATIGSIIATFRIFDKKPEAQSTLLPIAFVVALVSGFICWNLSNDNFFGSDIGDWSGLLLRVRGIFIPNGTSGYLLVIILLCAIQFEFVTLQVFFPHRLEQKPSEESQKSSQVDKTTHD